MRRATSDQAVELEPGMSRRTVVEACLVAGAVTLSGCTAYDTSVEAPTPKKPTGGGAGGALATAADVPVGGGLVAKDQKIVVTQPTNGEFKGFSAVCTHAGCVVSKVADGTINCPCHGSKFSIEDGSVVEGPAKKALSEVPIAVEGTQIVSA
jgi:Rieske Fe-S protein